MKNILLISLLFFVSFSLKAQSGFEMKGYFGISESSANRKVDLEGASSVTMRNFKEVGILFSKDFSEKFSLSGGLNYSFAKVDFNPNSPPCIYCASGYRHNPDFQLLSIPVYAEYALGKYFYAAAGPLVDFQLSEGNNFSDQSGFGYLVGLGGKVGTEKLTFSIFPNYKRHGVILFENNGNTKDILREYGIQLGLGYRF
jgi:hypothetical protein